MENPYAPPKAKIEGRRSASWSLTGRFLALMILAAVLALLLVPKTGLIVLLVPALLFPCLFVLPDFLFPTRTKVAIGEDGIDYEDFSQIIHAPWDSIRGLGEEPFFRFTRIVVDHPLANFCLSPHHPQADTLKAAVEQRLFGVARPDGGQASAPGQDNFPVGR